MNTEQKTIPAISQPAPLKTEKVMVVDSSQFANLLDTARFEHIYRVAQMYATSTLVPEQYQKQPSNCYIALQMALRMGIDPFMFMQNSYVVHGRPGIESKLAIALANARKVFADRIKYRLEGPRKTLERKCTAFAHDAATGELLEETVDMQLAQDEGWIEKPYSKWKTMPDLMLQYRSAMFLIRLHAPEVLMGLYAVEELEDMPKMRDMVSYEQARTVPSGSKTDRLAAVLESKSNGTQTPSPSPVPEASTGPGESPPSREPGDEPPDAPEEQHPHAPQTPDEDARLRDDRIMDLRSIIDRATGPDRTKVVRSEVIANYEFFGPAAARDLLQRCEDKNREFLEKTPKAAKGSR